jgi:hypothetical protein
MSEPATTTPGAGAPAATASGTVRSAKAERTRQRMLSPFWIRLFFLAKLPLALVAGLRLHELTDERCSASVPYGWRSTNPFRSTYFAALAMAAELSTGALALRAVESAPGSVALLITGMTASFEKKATARTTFTCTDGPRLAEAVARAAGTGEPVEVTTETVGTMADGTVVARFTFTWSFKARRRA